MLCWASNQIGFLISVFKGIILLISVFKGIILLISVFKGIILLIPSDPPIKENHVFFTKVSLKTGKI